MTGFHDHWQALRRARERREIQCLLLRRVHFEPRRFFGGTYHSYHSGKLL